mmetsp:Transcript_22136/g.68159  ORF Transcript_22136/g.68159 Transcript_22136/m.68159 type:complete len:395 (-) Transcript_22136:232-1416(-)
MASSFLESERREVRSRGRAPHGLFLVLLVAVASSVAVVGGTTASSGNFGVVDFGAAVDAEARGFEDGAPAVGDGGVVGDAGDGADEDGKREEGAERGQGDEAEPEKKDVVARRAVAEVGADLGADVQHGGPELDDGGGDAEGVAGGPALVRRESEDEAQRAGDEGRARVQRDHEVGGAAVAAVDAAVEAPQHHEPRHSAAPVLAVLRDEHVENGVGAVQKDVREARQRRPQHRPLVVARQVREAGRQRRVRVRRKGTHERLRVLHRKLHLVSWRRRFLVLLLVVRVVADHDHLNFLFFVASMTIVVVSLRRGFAAAGRSPLCRRRRELEAAEGRVVEVVVVVLEIEVVVEGRVLAHEVVEAGVLSARRAPRPVALRGPAHAPASLGQQRQEPRR